MEVPAGEYTVVVERGTEFERFEDKISVSDEKPAELKVQVAPWIRMNTLGWWSGDFHIHRPREDAPSLALAEDLNLSVVFTMWNKRDLWEEQKWPAKQDVEVDPQHIVTVLNAEDERGGGAWMFHGLREKLKLGVDGRWYPPGLQFIRQAIAQRYFPRGFPWFDSEKPFWWEVPVVMALSPPDSLGLLHNHFNQYGMNDNEAWGRPRDMEKYEGPEGFAEASMQLYYRYLNLGFRTPPSAGSASGVLPNPAGYNRVYVKLDEPFSVKAFYDALRDGRSFVTNGPMLFVESEPQPNGRIALTIEALSRGPLDRIEIVGNGEVIQTFEAPEGKTSFRTEAILDRSLHSWLAVRCFEKAENTIRLAHSRPIFFPEVRRDAKEDALFFVRWINELIEQSQSDPKRFASTTERDEVLELYERARDFYLTRSK
jgi:hypothetical protein